MTIHRTTTPGSGVTTGPGDDAITAELPVIAGTRDDVAPARPVRQRPVRDVYQRRRETAAATLLVAGGILIWSQISETFTAVFSR